MHRIASAIAVAGALALTPGSASANTVEPPQQPEPRTATPEQIAQQTPPIVDIIAMEIERYRRMTVPVTIMGEGPFKFMVDTGAQATVLSRALADQLQLMDRAPATLVGMASRRPVETTMVPEFKLGERNMTIRTAPLVEGANIGGADGILGLDSLQDQRVLLDFHDGEMHVSDSLGSQGSRGFDIVVRARERLGQLIIHQAEVDGIDVNVIVDTGAQGSVGNMALRDRLRRHRHLGDSVMTDVNGVRISGEARVVRQLELGSAVVSNIVISFAESPTFGALGLSDRPAMILGMSELRLFRRVAIDFRSSRVLFDLPRGAQLDNMFRTPDRATRIR
ncbi:aspartyl protease family protein [Aurantiacibacter odishensis]|uniref:aspartyl protease family protein n=1 Tax=Aurantiacibacter odishensis TaxID=1155476 RepID=UPI000E7244A9|nr:aspartyl protease family protein [Aurantiacibacter odishensis]